jgi:hypothetical protein
MTIRDYLNKKKAKASLISFFGIGIFILNIVYQIVANPDSIRLNSINGYILIIGLMGFFIGGAGVLLGLYGIKCPNCKGTLGYILSNSGSFLTKSKKIRFCPYCSVDFDSNLETIKSNQG